MNPTYRFPPPGEVLATRSVTLTTSDWARLDAWAAHLGLQLGVVPSRGRAVEHLLSLNPSPEAP